MKTEQEVSFWAKAVYAVLKKGKDPKTVFNNLKKSLGKKKIVLPIIKELEIIRNKEEKADLFLAKDLDDLNKKETEERLRIVIGQDKKINYYLDDNLLGGFQLKTKDMLIKASLKDALEKFKRKVYGYNRTI